MNHIALVAIGAVAGSVGTKILTSEPAKKVYVKGVVAGMCVRDSVSQVIEEAKAQFDDVCAQAEYERTQDQKGGACECSGTGESDQPKGEHASEDAPKIGAGSF